MFLRKIILRIITKLNKYAFRIFSAALYYVFLVAYRFNKLDTITRIFERRGYSGLELRLVSFKLLKNLPVSEKIIYRRKGNALVVLKGGNTVALPLQKKNVSSFNINSAYHNGFQEGISVEKQTSTKTLVVGHNLHPNGRFVKEGNTELHSYAIEDVSIFCNLQLFKGDDLLIFDPHHNPLDGSIGHGFLPIPTATMAQLNKVMLKTPDKKPQKLSNGLILSSKASRNYFHFLFEDLTRLMHSEELLEDKSMPIYIARDMPLQHYQALFGLLDYDRFILLDRRIPYTMDKLYVTQIPMNLSDNVSLSGAERFYACPEQINYMRTKLLDCSLANRKEQTKNFPKRIYIDRKGRSVINKRQLSLLMREHDIKVIDPSKLSFQDQVQLFSQAEIVIGAAGAGLSNIIFCKPGTRVIVLNSDRHRDNCVFSTIAHICGLEYEMITGPPRYKEGGLADFVVSPMASYLSPFKIDIPELERVLKAS